MRGYTKKIREILDACFPSQNYYLKYLSKGKWWLEAGFERPCDDWAYQLASKLWVGHKHVPGENQHTFYLIYDPYQ